MATVINLDLPYRRAGYVYSIDAAQWDFNIDYGLIGIRDTSGFSQADLKDVLLSKDGVDYTQLAKTSLISAGGYIHRIDGGVTGLYAQDAKTTLERLETNHISIINFEEVGGELDFFTLSGDEHVFPMDELKLYHKQVLIKHPDNINLRDKDGNLYLQGLVFCGELYWVGEENGPLTMLSDGVYKFDFLRWHLYEKIYHLKSIFNDADGNELLGLTPYIHDQISTEEVSSEKFIRSLFDISQTFLVVVKTDKPLVIERQRVPSLQLPKRYHSPEEIYHYQPLRTSDGRYLPYISIDDRNGISIATEENRVYPQQNDALIRADQAYLGELNVSSRRGRIRDAYFINIYRKGEEPANPYLKDTDTTTVTTTITQAKFNPGEIFSYGTIGHDGTITLYHTSSTTGDEGYSGLSTLLQSYSGVLRVNVYLKSNDTILFTLIITEANIFDDEYVVMNIKDNVNINHYARSSYPGIYNDIAFFKNNPIYITIDNQVEIEELIYTPYGTTIKQRGS